MSGITVQESRIQDLERRVAQLEQAIVSMTTHVYQPAFTPTQPPQFGEWPYKVTCQKVSKP